MKVDWKKAIKTYPVGRGIIEFAILDYETYPGGYVHSYISIKYLYETVMN